MRINQYIASCGICSRRSSEQIIQAGRIKLNGKVLNDLSVKICDTDVVTLDDKPITPPKKIYIIMNKPRGVLTTVRDERSRRTVLDILGKYPLRVFPVGRLDYDTSGLLILTNDGDFSRRVTHPSSNIRKTYVAKTKEIITGDHISELESVADEIKKISDNLLQIIIHTGYNRQVRKMLANVGLNIESLERTAIGKLTNGQFGVYNLQPGKYICTYKKPEI